MLKKEQIIKNYHELLSVGQKRVRQDALSIIQAGIKAGDPAIGTFKQVKLSDDTLYVAGKSYDLKNIEHIYVVGAGKGSFAVAEALEDILGSSITEGIVVTKRPEKRRLTRIEICEAGHPIPDEDSVIAARKILAIAQKAGENDLVFAAVTGGASALATFPPEQVPLQDIQNVTELLLKSGAAIRRINTVRKHLCKIKGGRLVAHIQPAEAITLTLDTNPEGMPWPDMCLADPTTFQDAIDVLHHYHLWQKVSPSIRDYLQTGTHRPDLETLKSLDGLRSSIISVGEPSAACQAAAKYAQGLDYHPVILSTNVEGEAKDAGMSQAEIVNEIVKHNRPFQPPCALISGGETTVTIRADCGKGGPNQEFVLGFARKFKPKGEVACVSVDTDGTDGPTEIAGGIVDAMTFKEAKRLNVNIAQALKNHNSSEALIKLKGAVITGNTGTNVLNLRVIVIR